jgi:ATP-dependent DNA helicase RecQ
VQVLAAWGWERRPSAVVSVASRTRPQLVRSLAHRIAETGRMPYLGEAVRKPGPDGGRANSAQRLAAVHAAFTLPAEVSAALSVPDPPVVLLVDDRIDTRWTITSVARILRQAGAAAVLPLVLAAEG